jgi:SAM-dependent methyltransferase
VLYALASGHLWVQVWAPSIAGALIVGALTVLVLDIVVNTAVEEARKRELRPLREASDREQAEVHEKVDRFLDKWQYVIGELRDDYAEVVRDEEDAASFPESLVAQLPFDTYRLLMSGWGQPNHDRVLAAYDWRKAVEVADQVKRQSDRIMWYSAVVDPSIPAAFAQIQEYLLAVVENMPRTGQPAWFLDKRPHRDFLTAYRTVWPDDDPARKAARESTRRGRLAIWQGLRDGWSELQAQEEDRSYMDPVLVGLHDAVNPPGPREDYYLQLVMSARAVLDLGCGTGRLLKRAARVRDPRMFAGVGPVLIGVDRASSMLAAAKSPDDKMSWEESLITWLYGDVRTIDVARRFDLITMSGRAFQELLTDDDIRMALSNVLRHLDPAGRFAFDMRRRGDEPLERLVPSPSTIQVASSKGEGVNVVHSVKGSIEPDLVEFTTTYTFAASSTPIVSRNVLRFIDPDHLRALLEDVGFRIDRWFGRCDHSPFMRSGADDVVVVAHVHS